MAIEVTNWYDSLGKFTPKSLAQRAALDCPAEVLKFGGAAGSLKSQTILIDALKYKDRKNYRGVIFRKTFPEIRFLIDRSRELYSGTGGRFYEADKTWMWPWGAAIDFKYMDKDKDVHKHQGWEYQYAGWDESTHQSEFQIRYIFNSRMRSVGGIPIRVRLATNPGGMSHKEHKTIFQGPKCVHCILKEAALTNSAPKWLPDSRLPFHVYDDAKWPSDGKPINATTCFIPGKVVDHSLFGVGGGDYVKKLKGMSKALQEALLEGCWEAFEGQYFDCFDLGRHYVPRLECQDKPWWPYWVGIDYGFGHATAAYLFTKAPGGMIYTIGEYVAYNTKAIDVARQLKKIWGHHNIKAWYLSPDAFRHDGTDDFSRAEQMSKETGIYLDQAYNERASGAMLMYTLLSENRWQICDSCTELPGAIQSRVHADRDSEDVEKTNTLEDDCYDGARYGLASHINPTEKPLEEQIREKQENEWPEDPTAAMMAYQNFMAGQVAVDKPFAYRPGHSAPVRKYSFGIVPPDPTHPEVK